MNKKAKTKISTNERKDREFVLKKAATEFRRRGFDKTTVKQVAEACEMLPGSLHYRYRTKETLLLDLMHLAMEKVTDAVLEAGLTYSKPEEQIRACINAHLSVLLTDSDMVYVLLFEWRSLQGDAAREMIKLRDRYEKLWAAMLKLLTENSYIREDIDLELLRRIGLGAINWVAVWYQPEGKYSVEDISDFIWLLIMRGIINPELDSKDSRDVLVQTRSDTSS